MNQFRRLPSYLSTAALCGVAAALALAGCEDRVAGTSVGTGNPTEIQVSFRDDADAAVPITGTMKVYASTQVTVSGYDPDPLLTVSLAGASKAALKADDFTSLHDSLWTAGSIQGAARKFNVVVMGAANGGVLMGFAYLKDKGAFELRAEDTKPVWDESGKVAAIRGRIKGLAEFKGAIDTTKLSGSLDYQLFIYGTGFTSPVVGGTFSFPKLPEGQYQSFLISQPKKDQQSTGADSATIFTTSAVLTAGNTELAKGDIHERVLLPDSLRIK
jgi:hypothetical protein